MAKASNLLHPTSDASQDTILEDVGVAALELGALQ
jgi:hypothetical protein